MKILTEKDINDCCGRRPEYYYTSTHQQFTCNVCKREQYIRHDWSPWYDDTYPDHALHRLVTAWNNNKQVSILDL